MTRRADNKLAMHSLQGYQRDLSTKWKTTICNAFDQTHRLVVKEGDELLHHWLLTFPDYEFLRQCGTIIWQSKNCHQKNTNQCNKVA